MSKGGLPIAGAEFDRIFDRSIGKPTQAVVVESKSEPAYTPEEYARQAFIAGEFYGLTKAQVWDRLPPEVQAVTPRPIVAVVKEKE